MKQKKIKIPINAQYIINRRSISNKNSRKNNIIFELNNCKINQNTNDIDISRNETTIETSVETMKKITIYKKNSIRPKKNLTLIRAKSNIFKKNNSNNKTINLNDNINNGKKVYRCTSAKELFKNNNYKRQKNKYIENFDNNYNLNETIDYFNLIRKTEGEGKIIDKNIIKKLIPNINEFKKKMKNNEFINIEDLMLLEEIFHDIILSIKMRSNTSNECFEFINFYNHSSLYNKFENFFKEEYSRNIVHLSILKMLFSIILIYHYSFNEILFHNNYEYLNIIINLNYKSYLLLCENISNKISVRDSDNIWVKKLKLMISYKLKHIKKDNKEFKLYLSSHKLNISNLNINLIEMKYYSFLIQKNMKILLRNLNNDKFQNEFYLMEHNISHLSGGEIIKFFRKKILRIINKNRSVNGIDASFYGINENSNFHIKIPYLNYKSDKKYTLILDLDETLISFKIVDNISNKGILRLRPGLYEFLLSVKNNYELIIFTSATKEYADPLIDAIEKKIKYFDFRLYRHHTIIYENEFVKDIGKLGRPMNKLIIVDNLPQNFRLQKENGIMIKPFWGEDKYDTTLYELGIILNKIANEFYDTRKGINEYRNDILSKVSSSFSKIENYQ